MKPPVVYSDACSFTWPGHVFPTGKYRAVARALVERGLVESFHEPAPATRDMLLTGHRPEYLDRLDAMADGREPWDPRFECPVDRAILDAFRLSTGGSVLAARLAKEQRFAANIGGGFHHAYPDHGEGFCLLNDVVVAAKVALGEGWAGKVLVVDLDVHQGNGTAVMARGDPRIFTLSVHQEHLYPPKERSDIDVGLMDRCDDRAYLEALSWALDDAARRFRPDLLIYLAGADPYERDRLGGLAVTMEGLRDRDRAVFDFAEAQGAATAVLLAGGYARTEDEVVAIHVATIETMLSRWRETLA